MESYLVLQLIGGRSLTVAQLENSAFIVNLINPNDSGRPNTELLLTRESFIGIATGLMFFIEKSGMEFESFLKEVTETNEFEFTFNKRQ